MKDQINNTDTTPIKTQDKNKLGIIPDGWTTPKISEVFQFINTTSFSRNQLNYDADNNLYYIHYGDIHSTYKKPLLDFELETNVPKLNNDVVLPNSVQYLQDGDVIIADASEDYKGVGEAIEIKNLNSKVAISGLHTFALRDLNSKTVAGFRTYIFKNPDVKKALKTIATGSKVYGISKGNIQKFKIVLPTIPEQKKIANILNVWDKAISVQEKLIVEKQELKNGLVSKLIQGELRFNGKTSKWKKTPLGKIPEDWSLTKLKDLTIEKGIVRGPFGGALKKEIFVEKGYKVYEQKNAIYSTIELGKYFIDADKFKELKRFSVKERDLIISCSGTFGRIYEIPKNSPEGVINQALLKLTLDNEVVLNDFFVEQFKWNRIQSTVIDSTQGGAMKNLVSISEFKNTNFIIPPIEEQRNIVSLFNSSKTEIENLELKLKELKKQKQGLMQQLLTGEKRVKI